MGFARVVASLNRNLTEYTFFFLFSSLSSYFLRLLEHASLVLLLTSLLGDLVLAECAQRVENGADDSGGEDALLHQKSDLQVSGAPLRTWKSRKRVWEVLGVAAQKH